MTVKAIGTVLIITGCSAAGFSIAQSSRKEIQLLHEIKKALSNMENTLQYDLRPLPELCRHTASVVSGPVRDIFQNLSRELDWQFAPDVYSCMCEAIRKSRPLPARVKPYFIRLGKTLGQFDIPGQIKELDALQQLCQSDLTSLQENLDTRLRSYRTLGVCAGAALAILFI